MSSRKAFRAFTLEVTQIDTGGTGTAHVHVMGSIGHADIDRVRDFVRGYVFEKAGCRRPTIIFSSKKEQVH